MFTIDYNHHRPLSDDDIFFYFTPGDSGRILLLRRAGRFELPQQLEQDHSQFWYIGQHEGRAIRAGYAAPDCIFEHRQIFTFHDDVYSDVYDGPEDILIDVGLRSCHQILEEDVFWAAARASQILMWDRRSRFCGACSCKVQRGKDVPSKVCPDCGQVYFPSLSPAIIVAVRKDNSLLMTKNVNHKGPYFGLVAGFVENGESIEQAVHREVLEETGLRIRNLMYWKSQAWPFPNSLMLAFHAEYESGEIVLQEDELSDARWFTPGDMPPLPPRLSVSRQLVEHFLELVDKH